MRVSVSNLHKGGAA